MRSQALARVLEKLGLVQILQTYRNLYPTNQLCLEASVGFAKPSVLKLTLQHRF